MCHVGTDSLLCSKAAVVLGGPAGRGDQPGDPPLQPEGRTSASHCFSPALGSCLQLSWVNPVPAEGCPEQQPHNTVQSRVVLLTTCVAGRGLGARAEMLAAASAGPSLRLAMPVNFSLLPQSLKNL